MQRRLLTIACLGSILGASVAWTQDPRNSTEQPFDDFPTRQVPFDDFPRDTDDTLRQQLLRLVEEKAELMDREELEEALSEIQNEIGELQALRKLEEAREILSSIVEEHEGTEGAGRAQRMLDTDDGHSATSEPRLYNPI